MSMLPSSRTDDVTPEFLDGGKFVEIPVVRHCLLSRTRKLCGLLTAIGFPKKWRLLLPVGAHSDFSLSYSVPWSYGILNPRFSKRQKEQNII